MTSEGERVDLRKLHEAATPGPWHVEEGTEYVSDAEGVIHWDYEGLGASWRNQSDAALIAALRNAAPFLLDVVEAARIALDHPYESGPDNVCIHCGVIGSYGHMAEKRQVMLRNALPALDSHLSAASGRETPE